MVFCRQHGRVCVLWQAAFSLGHHLWDLETAYQRHQQSSRWAFCGSFDVHAHSTHFGFWFDLLPTQNFQKAVRCSSACSPMRTSILATLGNKNTPSLHHSNQKESLQDKEYQTYSYYEVKLVAADGVAANRNVLPTLALVHTCMSGHPAQSCRVL